MLFGIIFVVEGLDNTLKVGFRVEISPKFLHDYF